MEYRRLGNSGLQLSELSFGSWITFGNQIEDKTSGRLLDMAYDAGINFFDNAEVYAHGASEEVMGTALGAARLATGHLVCLVQGVLWSRWTACPPSAGFTANT